MQHSSHINISLQNFFPRSIDAEKFIREMLCRDRFLSCECGKTVVPGNGGCGKNNVIYMGLNSGPKMANGDTEKRRMRGR
jgi:hypothetical protein